MRTIEVIIEMPVVALDGYDGHSYREKAQKWANEQLGVTIPPRRHYKMPRGFWDEVFSKPVDEQRAHMLAMCATLGLQVPNDSTFLVARSRHNRKTNSTKE